MFLLYRLSLGLLSLQDTLRDLLCQGLTSTCFMLDGHNASVSVISVQFSVVVYLFSYMCILSASAIHRGAI